MNASIQQRKIHFSGMVQGVGFRFTTRRIAQQYDVTGYVQNLPDGRVIVIAEGTANEIERFLVDVESKLGGYISKIEQNSQPSTGEFLLFEIRF